MRSVTRHFRKFHDPWGNKRGNRCARIVNLQYLLGKAMMPDYADDGHDLLNDWDIRFDRCSVKDVAKCRYVMAGKRRIEGIMR